MSSRVYFGLPFYFKAFLGLLAFGYLCTFFSLKLVGIFHWKERRLLEEMAGSMQGINAQGKPRTSCHSRMLGCRTNQIELDQEDAEADLKRPPTVTDGVAMNHNNSHGLKHINKCKFVTRN